MNKIIGAAIAKAERGDFKDLAFYMAEAHFGSGNQLTGSKLRDLEERFPAARAESCSDEYFDAYRWGTLDKLRPVSAVQTEAASNTATAWAKAIAKINSTVPETPHGPIEQLAPPSAKSDPWAKHIERINARFVENAS